MRSTRRAALVVGMAAALVTAAASSGFASAPRATGPAPKATDIGVTATTIHIAIIADVNTPLAPGLFKGSEDAIEAYARYINAHGGLAGRKVAVDFYDSQLSADESRNALIQACAKDFATVGTTALFMNNVTDAINCKDINGKPTGLPDVPELTTEPVQQNSPVSFPILVPSQDFSDPSGHTFFQNSGEYYWFQKHVTKNLHGMFLIPADLPATINSTLPTIFAAQKLGVKVDHEFNVYGMGTQNDYLPITAAIKSANATYVRGGSNDVSMADMRLEAQQQGVTSVKIWDCSLSCYSQRFLQLAGPAANGTYIETSFVPLEEAKDSPPVAAYLKAVGKANADGFGQQAWTAALFFQDVVQKIVAADGVNGLTRANFLATAKTEHNFTAQGMIGPEDVGGHKQGPCFALLQVRNDKFVRVYPSKPATFDCNPKNIVEAHGTLPG
jgi:ABC-type branched-subunit amino acid transport system substrate-binding protein